MGIGKLEYKGDFSKTQLFLNKITGGNYLWSVAKKYADRGLDALRGATPVDTGLTAASWYYDISIGNGSLTISWNNSNVVNGWANVALLLQYGHGTNGGGYVQGIDYINPALRPIFEDMANEAWQEVTK